MKKLSASLSVTLAVLFFISAASAQDNGSKQKASPIFKGVVAVAKVYEISPEHKNKIARIHFHRGQIVKKGDLLVEMYTSDKKLDVDYAKAAYDRARAKQSLAQERLNRAEKLKEKKIVSLAKYREAQLNLEMAAANTEIGKVELERANLILRKHKLYAPFDGQMSAPRFAENANVEVRAGSEIAKIVQLDPIRVRYYVPYAYFAKRKKELPSGSERFQKGSVRLILPDGSPYDDVGKIVAWEYDVNESGMLTATAEFSNPQLLLKPGLKVTLQAIESEEVAVAP